MYEIEAALDRDGVAQAQLFLDSLHAKKRTRNDLADILMRFEDFAATGKLLIPRELNRLTDELFEIKVSNYRFPFYYRKIETCGHVRVTHGFQKNTEKTPRKEIDLGMAIIREDMLQ